MRPRLTLVLLAVAIASVGTPSQATTCGGAPACGTALATIDGISPYSNGSCQCNVPTACSCGGTGTYGLDWQCVEFAQRYFSKRGWGTPNIWPGVSTASDMCTSYPSQTTKQATGVHGDAMVFPSGYVSGNVGGHVAIVDYVDTSNNVHVVEQNADISGRNTYATSKASCFIHASANVAPIPEAHFGPVDLDGDGKADWVQVQNSVNQGWIGLSNGDGTFGQVFDGGAWTWQSNWLGAVNAYTHYLADVNGDGKTDWIQVQNNTNLGYVGLSNGNGSIAAIPSNGGLVTTTGTSWTTQTTNVGAANSYTHYFADVNGDGKADWIQVENAANQGWVGLSNGDGTFAQLFTQGKWTWQSNAIGATSSYTHYFADVNGDGKADWIQVENATNQGWVGLSNGDGSFASLPSNGGLVTTTGSSWTWQSNDIGAANGYSHYLVDVNGDGKADWIQVQKGLNWASVGLANGDGSFATLPSNGGLVTTAGASPYWTALTTNIGAASAYTHYFADVNGDDKIDWIQVQNNTNQGWVGLSNGDGTFGQVFTTTAAWTWQSNLIGAAASYTHYFADVNGDGKLDWIQVQDSLNSAWVGLSNGDGSFAALSSNGGLVTTVGASPYWTAQTQNIGKASGYTHYLAPARTCIAAASNGIPSSVTSRSDGILKPLSGSCAVNPTLLWPSACAATSYNIELRFWDGASWQTFPQVNAIATTSYAFHPTQAATWWVWAVQACNGSGCSAFSAWDEIYVDTACSQSPPPKPPLPSNGGPDGGAAQDGGGGGVDSGGGDGGPTGPTPNGGCGCTLVGGSAPAAPFTLLLVAAALRRRRRAHRGPACLRL